MARQMTGLEKGAMAFGLTFVNGLNAIGEGTASAIAKTSAAVNNVADGAKMVADNSKWFLFGGAALILVLILRR